MVVVIMAMSATMSWSVVGKNWCLVVLGMVRTWFLYWFRGGNEKIARGKVRAVASRMAMVGSEKALVRSGLREGWCVWGVRRLIDVSPGRGAHVYAKRGDLLRAPRSYGACYFRILQMVY